MRLNSLILRKNLLICNLIGKPEIYINSHNDKTIESLANK